MDVTTANSTMPIAEYGAPLSTSGPMSLMDDTDAMFEVSVTELMLLNFKTRLLLSLDSAVLGWKAVLLLSLAGIIGDEWLGMSIGSEQSSLCSANQ